MRMPRPRWVPQTEEQRRAIAELEQAVQQRDEANEQVWKAARAARALGVSAKFIAVATGRGRTTVHKHVPPPAQPAP